jgi:hypothetical protein
MDPITIGAAIAGVKAAVGAAKNIQSIGHSLEGLFNAQEEHKKKQAKKQPDSRQQQILRMRAGDADYDDDTSISSVANDVLAEKANQKALEGLAREIDIKFGSGTWKSILTERQKRIEEKEKSEALAKENRIKKAKADKAFWHKVFVEGSKGIFIIAAVVGMVFFLMYAAEKGGSR